MKNKEMKLRRKKGKAEAVSKKQVKAPVRWQSDPSHPATHLAYITDAERELLAKLDMHGSGVSMENPHYGPQGIPSLNGMGGPGDRDARGGGAPGTGGMGPGGRGGTDGYGGRDTGGSSSGRGSTGQGGRDGGRGGDGTGNSGSSGNTGGASSSAGGGNRGGNDGGRSSSGRAGGVGTAGVGGGFGGGGNSGVGLGVGGLGGGIGGLGGGGYSGPKGGVIGPSDIGRAMSALSGSNAGRMGLAQASNALAGMRNSVSDVAWGGGGFFGETPSSNVQDKRDQGPLPGIAPGAFGNLGPVGGLGGLFASGAAPSVAQQAAQTTPNAQFGNAVMASPIGPNAINTDPAFNARNVDQTVANALRSNTISKNNPSLAVGGLPANSLMGLPSKISRGSPGIDPSQAAAVAGSRFGGITPSQVNARMGNAVLGMGSPSLASGMSDPLTGRVTAANQPAASRASISPGFDEGDTTSAPSAYGMGTTAQNPQGIPGFAGMAQAPAVQNYAADFGRALAARQSAQAPSISDVAAQVQSPTMSASMSPRNRASLAPAMAAIGARNAAPASTDLSGVPGAFSNTTDTSGYTDVTDEARNIAQGNYMDAFKGGLEKLGLGNMLNIGGMLSGMGNPNLGNDGTNRGGNDRAIRGLLEAMNPQSPAPEEPGTVRPGNWVPPGLLMRPNPFPAVWQNRNPWNGYL